MTNDKQINWKWLLAHTAIIWFSTFLGGFVVGFLSEYEPSLSIIGWINLIIVFIIVFIISLVQNISWKHLFLLIVLLFITSIPNLENGFTFSDIFFGSIIGGVVMVLAKGISGLFKKGMI